MARGKYDRYSEEFQQKAMALGEEIGCNRAASRLGISNEILRKWTWRRDHGRSMTKKDTPEAKATHLAQLEIKKLKRENDELKKANLILREVASIFSKDRLNSSLERSLNSSKKGKKK